MFGQNAVPDKSIHKNVSQRLMRTGADASRITVAVQSGTVTLSGTLKYEISRRPIVKAVGQVTGVRRVIDQLKLNAKKRT